MPARDPTFGLLLAEQLQAKKRSVDWLAKCLHVPASTVTDWLTGKTVPTSATLISAMLDCLELNNAPARQRFLSAAGWLDNQQAASAKMPPQGNKPTADAASGVTFDRNQSVHIAGNVITGGTVNQTNVYGPISGPVHTGSGNIYVDETKREGSAMPDDSSGFKEAESAKQQSPAVPQVDKEPPAMQRPIKILFLTANPQGTGSLRVDEELRAIDQALRLAEHRHFELIVHQAMRIDDLQERLLRHRPDIVHFSGHGTARNELILQDGAGNAAPVPGPALRALFANLKDNIRLVVFNACHTEAQARSIAECIDCVVGMGNDLTDQAAIHFTTAFYLTLGYGRSVETAFNLGKGQLALANEESAVHLYGKGATQLRFVDEKGSVHHNQTLSEPDTHGQSVTTNEPSPHHNQTDIHQPNQGVFNTGSGNVYIDQRRQFSAHLLTQLFIDLRSWANDFFRLDEATDHDRSSWEGMALYLLGAPMRRLSGEKALTFTLAAGVTALALLFIMPILDWPQSDRENRAFVSLLFGAASIFLPLFIALLVEPVEREQFGRSEADEITAQNNVTTPTETPSLQRTLLLLKLVGAWTGFFALAGTVFLVVILWYHLLGTTVPFIMRFLLALLPPFFAYVSARRTPLNHYRMFAGEVKLHSADPLFLGVGAAMGPVLAAGNHWGSWFLINRGAMLSTLLGIIGLATWTIHRRNKSRFPDPLMIAILGFLLPIGWLLLFFFDIEPLAPTQWFNAGTIAIALFLSLFFLGITSVLATVAVRQQTTLTLMGSVGCSVIALFFLLILILHLWVGRIASTIALLLWYLWGRRQAWKQGIFWVHPSIDWLLGMLIGAALVGNWTAIPLWLNATFFALIAGLLTWWAYTNNKDEVESVSPTQPSPRLWWCIALLFLVNLVGFSFIAINRPHPSASISTPAQDAVVAPTTTPTVPLQPTITATTATPAASMRLSVARPAPGDNRYFIEGSDLAAYELLDLLAVYGQAGAGQEFDVAVVVVVDKNVDNLIVQVIFQNEANPLDSLAALQLDDRLANVDLASMTPVNEKYVGFMLEGATVRLVANAPVTVDAQLEARQFTRSGDTLSFPDGPLLVQIDSIGTDGKVAAVSSMVALPPVGTLLVLADPASDANTP